MRKILFLAFMLTCINCISQPGTKSADKNIKQKPFENDSALIKLRQFDDSIAEANRKNEELKDIEKMTQRSMDYFVQLQKERHAKEKRNAIIRISIGVLFLIVLIFGLRRRIKKQ